MSDLLQAWVREPGSHSAGAATRIRWQTMVVVTALLAVGLRLATLVLAGHLTGVFEYDDGVYFGSAVLLIHGHLPYRDFVLIQPPGLILLLTPFALLSNWVGTDHALELARLAVPLVAGANVVLLGLVLRRKAPLVVAVACLFLAVYPDDILASTALLLEPFLIFFCLLAVLAIFDGERLSSSGWRIFWAGTALGFAADIKLWAAFPAVVLLLVCLPRPARALALIAGAALGWVLPALPFLVAAPVAFWHQVVVDQAGRSGASALSPLIRLEFLTGVWPGLGVPKGHLYELLAAAVALAVAIVVVVALATSAGTPDKTSGRPRWGMSHLEFFALGTTLVTGVALLIPADFFYHYAAFFGAFLALALGLAAGRLAVPHPQSILVLAAVVGGLGVIHALAIPVLLQRAPTLGPQIAAVIPAGSCVVADDSEEPLTANRFVSSSPNCPLLVDALGTTIAISGSQDPASIQAQAASPTWLSYFRRAQYVILTPLSPTRIPWDGRLERYLELNFRAVAKTPLLILQRLASPAAQPQFSLLAN
jgi:alpha-1,2-mannosyltransferase